MFSLFHGSRYENDAGNKANRYFLVFLTVEIFVKMSPLYGKEQAKNCRKKMSKDKLREVHGKKGNRKS